VLGEVVLDQQVLRVGLEQPTQAEAALVADQAHQAAQAVQAS